MATKNHSLGQRQLDHVRKPGLAGAIRLSLASELLDMPQSFRDNCPNAVFTLRILSAMKTQPCLISCFLLLCGLMPLAAQNSPSSNTNSNTNNANAVPEGWRGFLSISYKESRFVIPYSRIVSVSRAQFVIDGGGKVDEVTVDTTGGVVARFYYLESLTENNPLNAVQIINNRAQKLSELAEKRTGEDGRQVVKHYPDTTHAKTVEFNLSQKSQLDAIFNHITRKWIDEGGDGPAQTLSL
ncbi:MAG: hypothetical protein DVB23_000432 [Verrucomicrobia bacterium]|jgi:hypothetical protein|nr:MAG: hypothetical protein DVB23_000432 [Verrucomicrobiota bacterium]